MIKLRIILIFGILLPFTIAAQSEKISNRKVKDVIDKMELYAVDIIEVKTLKKWKALNLSHDMKSQMNYNVVRVKYKTNNTFKTVLIDMHLVPINYNIIRPERKNVKKNDFASIPESNSISSKKGW